MKPPRVLIVAGSDSGGGAGIQADIKTVTMLGGFATTAITAITAQNTLGVTAVMPVPAEMVVQQMEAVLSDIGTDAVKIGMIGSAETVEAVASRLSGEVMQGLSIVFDPVMIASSGSVLADEATIAAFDRIAHVATLITPNAPELSALTGRSVETEAQLQIAAKAYAVRTGTAILAKGGHLAGESLVDLLVAPDGQVTRWSSTRIDSRNTHGTGCTLSSAIAAELGRGRGLVDSITRAREFVRAAMRAAPGFGAGHGAMGHQAVRSAD